MSGVFLLITNFFHKIEKGTLLNSFYKAIVTLIPKLDITRKKITDQYLLCIQMQRFSTKHYQAKPNNIGEDFTP